MAKRPCLDCGKPAAGTRCEPCRLKQGRTRERTRDRRTAAQRGYTATYRRLRAIVLRGNPACWICHLPGADTADHVIPVAAGGTNTLANLRPAHARCNSRRGGVDSHRHPAE